MVDDVTELSDAMQRVDDLRRQRATEQIKHTVAPYLTSDPRAFMQKSWSPQTGGGYQDKLPYMPAPAPTRVTPAPEEALRSVAAFRQEMDRRVKAYQGMVDVMTATGVEQQRLNAMRPRLASVGATPQQKVVDERYAAFSQKLADLRADLIEMGLNQDQIDKLSK
jgi:hypothetical protein